MKKSENGAIRKRIKIDLEKNIDPAEIAKKHGVSIGKVRRIINMRPSLCNDSQFLKYEKIREHGCLDEFATNEITSETLKDIFSDASRLILTDGSKKHYENLVFPIQPREWEMRQAICDALSKRQYNHLMECPIRNPLASSNSERALWTDLAILTEKGIIDIELKDAKGSKKIRNDFRKLLSAPPSTVGTACFYLFNDANIESQRTSIITDYKKAYRLETENLKGHGVEMFPRWFLFFLLAFEEKRILSFCYENILDVDFEKLKQTELNFIEQCKILF